MLVVSQPRDQGAGKFYDGSHGKLTQDRQQDHAQGRCFAQGAERDKAKAAEQEGEEEVTMYYTPIQCDVLNLVECSDGKYRTPEYRDLFEAGKLQEIYDYSRQTWVEMPR